MPEQGQRFLTSQAISSTSQNVLLGTLFMQPMQDCGITIAAAVPAADAGIAFATVRIGGRVVLQEAIVPTESIAGQGPTPLSTGNLYSGGVLAGELVEYVIRNASGALVADVTSFVNMNPR
jgi:hypothetical protein